MREMHGEWMREQRQARGWSVPQMLLKLREAAASVGDTLPDRDCLLVMIHRWENNRSGISERYRLHYCAAFQIPAVEFGSDGSVGHGGGAGVLGSSGRGCLVPGADGSVGGQLLAAAQESGEHARGAERRGAGEVTLEGFRVMITRLSRESLAGGPVAVFGGLRRARDQVLAVAGERSWPGDRHEAYVALGCVNSLMAGAAQHAGSPAAAEEFAMAGLAYASVIGCRPLIARLRLDLAVIGYWYGRFGECLDQAGAGLESAPGGLVAAQLHLVRARAAARLGDSGLARDALAAADQAGDGAGLAGLAETMIQIRFSPAARHYYAGAALALMPGAAADAIAELEHAVSLYAAASEPDGCRDHDEMAARVDLACARLGAGDLEGAQVAAVPVLALPCARRVSSLLSGFGRVRGEMAGPRYRDSAEARQFDSQIERFCAHAIVSHLHDTPAADGGVSPQSEG